jgi:CubicO group peptidase (beta-lactamase class C family)
VLLVIGCTNSENSRIDLERLKVVEELLTDDINNNKIPGAVVLVGNEKEIVYQKAFGVKNPLTNEKYATDDIFRIASMTKAITSVAVLKLWEDGRINLDDPIEKYIPEFKDTEILETFNEKDSSYTSKPSTKKITIRQLLTHTSGIGYDFIDGNPSIKAIFHKKKQSFMKNGVMCFCDEDVTIGEAIRNLAEVPLHHEPGEKFTYSMGLDVLGYMIEIVSGKKLDVFYREEIFDPLDMNDTYFYLPDSKKERLVPVQTKKDENWVIFEDDRFNENYPIEGKRKFFAGGCGLSSTVEDYYKFLSVFLNNGKYKGKSFIGKQTNDLLFQNQLPETFGFGIGLALGIVLEKDLKNGGTGTAGTLLGGGYWNTSCFTDPNDKVIGIIFKQTQKIPDNSSNLFKRAVVSSIIK